MSLLIIGGAFVVALLAIVGIFLLVRSDGNGKNEATTKNVAPPVGAGNAPVPPATPAVEKLPAAPKATHVVDERERPYSLNGQFHEVSQELHTLQRQAAEIERRLGVLHEMLERAVRDQHFDIDEDTHVPTDTRGSRE